MSHAAPAYAPPELTFAVEAIEPLYSAPAPTLRLALRIDAGDRAVRGLGLNVRIEIHAERRRHTEAESDRLGELFGPVEEWPRSLGAVPWTQVARNVGPFDGATVVDLHVPCTYDFDVAAAKYLAALDEGEVPLELLFSGNVHWTAPDGRLQLALVPWDREATARMPVRVWREAMRASFGDTAWLRLQRDVFARLQEFRSNSGFTTWDDTIEALLRR